MMIVGLTGPTGAGKTLACETLRNLGAEIINADQSAREVTKKGCPVLKELALEFGEGIIISGELDRRELARRAFADKYKTQRLNEIIFPYIVEFISQQVAELKESGAETVVLDAPTLFESGCQILCDVTVAILSQKENRLPRILERDGISEEDAVLRIGAGKADDFYKSRADYIIYNDSDANALQSEIEELYNSIIK